MNLMNWLACVKEPSFIKNSCSWFCYYCFELSYTVEISKSDVGMRLYHCNELLERSFYCTSLEFLALALLGSRWVCFCF